MKSRVIKILCAAVCCAAMTLNGMAGTMHVTAAEPVVRGTALVRKTPGGTANFERGNASITIKGNQGQTLKGKKFQVYQLFDAESAEKSESINYTFHKPFEKALKEVVSRKISKIPENVTEYEVIDYIQSLQTEQVEGSYSSYRYFIEELRDEIVKEQLSGDLVEVTETTADNSVVICGLEFGYYVVDEVTSVGETHSAASLCMVNTASPDAGVHIKSDYPTVIKKIQEDDHRGSIGTDGWNDIADFEIGQTVPYKYESDIPNMNGYDTYYYAWHDVMDEALTFQEDSVKISIRESADADSKKYELKREEYEVIQNPDGKETFQVQIRDIKSIVDREFPDFNSKNENTYGQRVILTYDAILNEKAAEDTGRPGFENDVRLEFSNDADHDHDGSTGFTPWDTVVCFTYQLNGLKTNDQKLKLEGAKFRLYSDEKCKNEVYVRKADDGYIVINRDSLGGNDHTGGAAPGDAVEMMSDKEGLFTIYGIDGGTYYLKETEAPDGYRPLLDPIQIQVSPEFTEDRDHYVKGEGASDKILKNLTATAYVKEFLSGAYKNQEVDLQTDVSEGSANITVVNRAGMKLPVTGSCAMILLLGTGSVLIMYSLMRKKKK